MKTVWIKHNHLQELLPIQEWQPITIEDGGTHVIHYYGKNAIGIEHPLHKENFSNGYLFYEYIGDQRGDGWFYVADGDLPIGGDENVLAWNLDAHKSVTVKASTLIHHYNRSVTHGLALVYPCWQPIQPPKHLD